MTDLKAIASQFRAAIERAIIAGELKDMETFPRGCCAMASDLLQRYLVEHYQFFTWYMSGEYGYGRNGESHAWLETQDGLVIDITGDQYKNKKLKFSDKVYVGIRDDGFHDKFKLHNPVPYSVVTNPIVDCDKSDLRYKAIMKYIE